MILDKIGAIFVHIPKTAGSSITKAMSKFSSSEVETFGRFNNVKVENKHHSARKHIEAMGRDKWDSLESFCVIRHPYSRVLSNYRWAKALNVKAEGLALIHNFEEYVMAGCPFFLPASYYTQFGGRTVIDHVLRYESLQEDYENLLIALNIKPDDLPEYNKLSEISSDNHEPYTQEMKNKIQQICWADFRNFGYQP